MEEFLKYKNSLVALAVVATMSGATIIGSGIVGAQSDSGNSIVDRIASTFNLNKDEVQQVFNDAKADKRAEFVQRRDEHLNSLVEDGTITEAQKTTLQDFAEKAKSTIGDLKDSGASKEEIRTAMEQSRKETEDWADSEGLDLNSIRPDKGDHMHRGRHHRFEQDQNEQAI